MRSSSPSVSRRGPPGAGTALCDAAVREGADDGVGQLALERRDLAAQLRAGGALVGDDARTSRTSSDATRESTWRGPPRPSEKRLGAAEQRLLDVQRRHPGHRDREQPQPPCAPIGAPAGRDVAEEHRHRRARVGHDAARPGARSAASRPPPAARRRARRAAPAGPSTARVVQRPHRHAGLDHAPRAARPRAARARRSRPGPGGRAPPPPPACAARRDRGRRGGRRRGRPPGPARGAGSARGRRGSGRPAARRRSRSAVGVRRAGAGATTETSRSSGNSSASSRSTQPSSSAGSAPLTAALPCRAPRARAP